MAGLQLLRVGDVEDDDEAALVEGVPVDWHPLTRHHLDLSLLDHGPRLSHNADGSETIFTIQSTIAEVAFSRLVIGLHSHEYLYRVLTCRRHRLNMELDLQSLFGLHVHSFTHWLSPRDPPPPPPHLGLYTRALLVSQDRRHLFVTPLVGTLRTCSVPVPEQLEFQVVIGSAMCMLTVVQICDSSAPVFLVETSLHLC